MTWDKPTSALKWLMLFAPASLCVIATIAGGLIEPQDGDWMGWALMGLLGATISSLGLAGWLARKNPSAGGKFACALLIFAILMVVNCAVSFAGCAAGSTMLPGMDFR